MAAAGGVRIVTEIVTLVHGALGYFALAMMHLACSGVGPIRLIVVDNASPDPLDPLVPWLREVFADVRVVTNPDNGIYRGLNLGLAETTEPIVGVVTSDTLVYPGWWQACEAFLTTDHSWVSPLSAPMGPLRVQAFVDALTLGSDVVTDRFDSSCFVLCWPWLRDHIGTFDERFFYTFGDTDYLERLRARGVRWGSVGRNGVPLSRELGHQSSQQLGTATIIAWQQRDALAFMNKWQGEPDVLARHRTAYLHYAEYPAALQALWAREDAAV